MFVYSVWAVRELNFVPAPAAMAVVILSSLTLPLFYVITGVFYALPFFLMIPLIYVFVQKIKSFATGREQERQFQLHQQVLTANPQDADAHRQLALVQMKRGNLGAARAHIENALRIHPGDPEYHYALGRIFEEQDDWPAALGCYEETYRIDPQYGTGDIFREVGKGYLHTGKLEKAIEFLRFFLSNRDSDLEGRYWLAVALQRLGSTTEMRAQLNTVLEQARSNPRFFRREKRQWIYRARQLLKSS
jgi:tetratricopeptide (TPR) repeat protein